MRLRMHWNRLLGWLILFSLSELASGNPNVVVVVDDSGSMKQLMKTEQGLRSRIDVAKGALTGVLQKLPPETRLGILLLNQHAQTQNWLVPLEPLKVDEAVRRVQSLRADGGTPLGARIKGGADALLEAREKQIYGDFRLLVITDGEATDPDLLFGYMPDILSRGLKLDVIGVDMVDDHSLARLAHSYRRANDSQSLSKALQEVFAESTASTTANASGSSASVEDDFAVIADLPDDFATEVLASLAIPDNQAVQRKFTATASLPSSTSPNLPNPPATINQPVDGLVGAIATLFSLLPCCMIVVVGFIVVVALTKKKRKRR
jgi:hypothetical protein